MIEVGPPRASVYLHHGPGRHIPWGILHQHRSFVSFVWGNSSHVAGAGVRLQPKAPAPRAKQFPGKSPAHVSRARFAAAGPTAGQRFPAAGKSPRENRLLPTPSRGEAGPMPAAAGICWVLQPRALLSEGRCEWHQCPPRVCPGPRPAPLSSPGEHEAGMMDVFFLRQTRPEQPSTWLRSQGPSPSPGTCSAAPSTARHRSCCSPGGSSPGFAPGDSWPALWGPSLVLSCTGR